MSLVTERQYWELHQRLDHASYTDLVAFERNPRVYSLSKNRKATDDMVKGQLLDCLLLSPHEFDSRFHERTEKNANGECTLQTKAAKAEYARILASGKIPIHPKWRQAAEEEIASLLADTDTVPSPKAILAQGRGQVAIRQRFGSVWFLSKPDWVPARDSEWGDWIIDVKRTSIDDVSDWGAKVSAYRYHWQAASQLDAYNTEFPDDRRSRYGWLIVTGNDCGLLECDPDDIALGRAEYVAALLRYRDAFERNEWRSPFHSPDGLPRISRLPDWYRRQSERSHNSATLGQEQE